LFLVCHSVLDGLASSGVLSLVDYLMYECHYPISECVALERRLRAAAPATHLVAMTMGGGHDNGYDSASAPRKPAELSALVHACRTLDLGRFKLWWRGDERDKSQAALEPPHEVCARNRSAAPLSGGAARACASIDRSLFALTRRENVIKLPARASAPRLASRRRETHP